VSDEFKARFDGDRETQERIAGDHFRATPCRRRVPGAQHRLCSIRTDARSRYCCDS
jgi:hypothetical protein